MNNNISSSNLYYPYDSLADENIEGGLNIGEIINIIVRKFPYIASCTIAITLLAIFKISTKPTTYDASFEILSEPLNIETSVTSTNFNARSTETREEITSVELDEVQLKIIKSPKVILRAVESLQSKYPTLSHQEVIDNLHIEIINQSNNQNILLVKYQHSDKEQVVDVINNLAKIYVEYSLEKRQSGIKRGIAFLDLQIPKVDIQVREIENNISQLRSKHNFLDPQISIQQVNNRLNNLSTERKMLEIQYQDLKLKANNLERELKAQPVESSTAIDLATPRYVGLLNQLQNIDLRISAQSILFSDRSIEIQTLKQEREQLIGLLLQETNVIRQKLANQIDAMENRRNSITAETAKLQSQLSSWSIVFRDYNHLQEKLTISNKKLNEFNLQKDALLIDAAQQEAPWQLLNPPTEPRVNNVSTINYLILSSGFGLLLSIGGALLIDSHQKIIYTTDKIQQLSNLPILITIPHIRQSKRHIHHSKRLLPSKQTDSLAINQKSVSAEVASQLQSYSGMESNPFSIEVFRSFATNLNIFNLSSTLDTASRSELKSLVITSAIPGEGKSTVALNLAKACASLGKKILLVDTDFRSTDCLTTSFSLESEPGLIDILHEVDDISELKYINQLPLENNLFVLSSGFNKFATDSISADSSRLLASARMDRLMEELEKHFDLIIYDIAAVNGFADVNLLSTKADGVVVVTGLGKIQATELKTALNQLKKCQAPILGIAANNIVNQK
ncbi:MAG: polysaccharide biosynthesis tyrosine autokinase [Cyanobacteria bacterium P01_G01_bin.19]